MHAYRSHTCGALRIAECGTPVRLSGWIHRKRDHGGLLFLDIRDHYGITQCVVDSANPSFKQGGLFRLESVISVDGVVVRRSPQAVNPHLATGEIEVQVQELTLLSLAETLPIPVNNDAEYPEEMRLRYRFLDLRRDRLHENIVLRSRVISSLREHMTASGFIEIQTPILTASSPEGARDFLVPSRLHPGKFYALPQAPQIFKQMLMTAGFDRYFQIAPCFRDEDGRADRSPTEFYQLDIEMSFVTQEDVFAALEPVLHGVFSQFGKGRSVTEPPFPRIPYETSMLTYGSDKPDLRNPLEIRDVTDIFKDSSFRAFSEAIAQGSIVRAIPAPGTAARPRSFFDRLGEWAKNEGAPGLAYVIFDEERLRGPLAKFLNEEHAASLRRVLDVGAGDAVVFLCGPKRSTEKLAGAARKKIGEELQMIDTTTFKLCWVVDFPMYELNEETNTIDFGHNPFSMPQGGLEALQTQDPLAIKAFQYDIVCNGYELSSGAIRNHVPEIMYAAFAIAGYDRTQVEQRFGGLLNAFKYGAPPHGGSAPGIDRIVMLLADEPNLREIVAFPTTQQGEDLLMQAPASVGPERLKELHIRLDLPSNDPIDGRPKAEDLLMKVQTPAPENPERIEEPHIRLDCASDDSSGGGRPPHVGTQASKHGTPHGIPPHARSREGTTGGFHRSF